MKQLGITRGSLIRRVQIHEFQFDLFRKLGLPETCAERSEFRLSDDALARIDRGEDIDLFSLSNYRLISRATPIRIFDEGSGCRAVNGFARYSYAKTVCGSTDMTADESKLFNAGQMVCSVEHHETPAFATGF